MGLPKAVLLKGGGGAGDILPRIILKFQVLANAISAILRKEGSVRWENVKNT